MNIATAEDSGGAKVSIINEIFHWIGWYNHGVCNVNDPLLYSLV